MHVRAIKKTRYFVKSENVESDEGESLALDYPQDDTIETITINYPTDEDVPEYIPAPKPIKLSERYARRTKIKPDIEISEITHRPEPVEPRLLYRERASVEYAPKFTDNPPPSEVLPVPLSEPDTEVDSAFMVEGVQIPESYDFEESHPLEDDEIMDSSSGETATGLYDEEQDEDYSETQPEYEFEPEPELEPPPLEPPPMAAALAAAISAAALSVQASLATLFSSSRVYSPVA